ncbi:hypothetical protein HYW61_01305 [candidate division WWE3 bacterium]|nr:hypothetical protein [candidate division WWE3 bacterium]
MQVYGTITPSWQLHIPVAARKIFKKHGRVKIDLQKGSMQISPDRDDFMSLAETFKVKNPIPADKIRDYIDYSDL